jgi:hypothetical protein
MQEIAEKPITTQSGARGVIDGFRKLLLYPPEL